MEALQDFFSLFVPYCAVKAEVADACFGYAFFDDVEGACPEGEDDTVSSLASAIRLPVMLTISPPLCVASVSA